MTEADFFEKIKLSAQNYKAKSDSEAKDENPISWKKTTYHALYNIAPGMAADSLVMARRKSGSLDSSSGDSWKDDKTSQEITRTFMNLVHWESWNFTLWNFTGFLKESQHC